MSIENRHLKPGTRLVARYKGKDYSAEVVKTDEGLRYRLPDGQEFKSPSSAGSGIMGGNACNGWRFWTIAAEETIKPARSGAKKSKVEPAPEGADEQK